MDTKLKSIKYSFFTKFICWALSLVFFCLSFSVISKLIIGSYILGPEAFIKEKQVEFFDTDAFMNEFTADFFRASDIATEDKDAFYENVNKYKEQTVNEVYNEFLEAKAEIIGNELYYAVNNWDADYYQYEDSVDDIENTETTTVTIPHNVTLDNDSTTKFELPDDAGKYISVPNYAPENIKVASYALNTANGIEFLKYEPLVRDGAFQGEFFVYKTVSGHEYHFGIYYTLNAEDAKKEIERVFDQNSEEEYNRAYSTEHLKMYLEMSVKNLKYYIVDYEDNVTSNIKAIPSNLSNKSHYILANGANVKVIGFNDNGFTENLKKNQVKTLCLYFDEDFKEDDSYGKLCKMYNIAKELNVKMLIIELTAALVIAVIFFIILLKLAGKRPEAKKDKKCFIDKIPNDIHFVLSFGVITALTFGIFMLWTYIASDENLYSVLLMDWEAVVPFAYLVAVFGIFTEWLTSVIRIKRSGDSYFKNTVIYKLLRLFKRCAIKIINCFAYKPKAAKIRFSILFALYLLVNALLVGFAVFLLAVEPIFGLLPCPFIFIFNIVVFCLVVNYVNTLDKIIATSSEHEDIKLNMSTTPRSLKILADNLSYKNKSIDKAVAEAVKNEQMKTQLITNVSHDLKTPLTSLINYSDLLSKCELNNEDAEKYVEVINQKSDKLKHLIEDLIEASKASTGNIVLNRTKLNLSELSVQAIGEYMPDFEKSFIDVRFTEPAEAPIIFADGTKTYRIISNLLSNAKKYSAPDTRVYINVFTEGDFGCFEIKNISKEALNINPEQLTERFVRGDESRTNEGNGLGLAIAKDLCSLQNGVLNISIDGDLFKATVKLPLSK